MKWLIKQSSERKRLVSANRLGTQAVEEKFSLKFNFATCGGSFASTNFACWAGSLISQEFLLATFKSGFELF